MKTNANSIRWQYFGLLGQTKRAIVTMDAIVANKLASEESKALAKNILVDLYALYSSLEKQKEIRL